MSEPNTRRRTKPNGRLALGLFLVGTGRPAGFAEFGATVEAYLTSLAPLLAILLVMTGLLAWPTHVRAAAGFFLPALCALLAPSVIAEMLCRWFQCTPRWAQYANVMNCAQWLMVAALACLVLPASVAVTLGMPLNVAVSLLLAAFSVYALWFHWFAARHVLHLPGGRAVVMMLGVVVGTGVLLQIPVLIAGK